MKCNHCQTELPKGADRCPGCGAQIVTRTSPALMGLCIAIVVLLAAALTAILVIGMRQDSPQPTEPSSSESVATDPTVTDPPATTPADTGRDDETCKGTYTADDETVAQARDTVVATLGDAQLTNGQLQVYYWMEVSGFYNQYYYYASYLGIDFNQPLDTQLCPLFDTTTTWQQYFISCAVNNWINYQALVLEGEQAQYQLAGDVQAVLDGLDADLASQATEAQFETVEAYLYNNLGAGATVEDYKAFMNQVYYGGEYFGSLQEQYVPTDDEVEAYFQANAEAYAANGLTKEYTTVNARHILIMPEGATSSTILSETFSQEAWDAALATAEGLKAQWEAGEKTEEAFGALANEHSQDNGGNVTNGGIYENITAGQMVAEFDSWCFDPSRQVGDCGIVTTIYGHHVMYFCGSQVVQNETWMETVRTDMINEHGTQLLADIIAKYAYQVNYADMLIGTAGIFQPVG